MRNGRKRVLFVSYWVAPRKAIGTIRSRHVMQHLPEFGWDVDTLTARFDTERNGAAGGPCIETGYYDVKGAIKRFAGIGERSTSQALNLGEARYGARPGIAGRAVRLAAALVTYPDDYVGWLPYAAAAIRRAVESGQYDAILTSAPPATTNLAAALSHGSIPWIADQRDLWAEDDSAERSRTRAFFDDKLERATLAQAAAIVASSKRSAARFHTRYPEKPCYDVSTGYEPDEWSGIGFGAENACTLLYAGNFYRGRRDPTLLFEALSGLFRNGSVARSDVRVDLYSEAEPWLLETISKYGLEGVVNVRGFVERKEVLGAERRADRLLVFAWDGGTAEGVVPGKLFEYFGARRPILAIGGTRDSTVNDLLKETGTGTRCLTAEDVQADILTALREHRAGIRIVPEDRVCSFTSENCARAFAEILDSLSRAPALQLAGNRVAL